MRGTNDREGRSNMRDAQNAAETAPVIPVFVGSTYEDLKPHRTAVMDALMRLGCSVRGMEYFGAKPGSPKEECLNVVASCRIYIGIFAMRYGSVDEETGKSMTHLEYEEAQRLELPTLIYLIDEEHQPILPSLIDKGGNAEKLSELKSELRDKFLVGFFTTPDDLATKIAVDLQPLVAQVAAGAARRDAEKAAVASRVARVYYSLTAVLAGRLGGHSIFRHHALQLLTLAEMDATVSYAEYVELPPASAQSVERAMAIDGPAFEIVKLLAREGLIEHSGTTVEDSQVRIAPEFLEPIRMAFGYLRETTGDAEPEDC